MLWAWLKKILFPSTGAWAEREAAKFLKDKGIKILARNYKAHPDELDIIAREKRELVFVEVRARKAQAIVPGAQTLGAKKHHALRRGIRAYLR